MNNHKFTFECPNCEREETKEFEIEPLIRGRLSGPPEDCYPDEGGYASITDQTCSQCGDTMTKEAVEKIEEAAYQDWEDSQDDEPHGDLNDE